MANREALMPAIRSFRDTVLLQRAREDANALSKRGWLWVPFEVGPLLGSELAADLCTVLHILDAPHLVALHIDPSSYYEGDVFVELPLRPQALEEWSVQAS